MRVNGTAARRVNNWGRLFSVCTCVLVMSLAGCASIHRYIPAGPLPYEQLSAGYYQVNLQRSSALEVIRSMQAQQGSLDPRHVETELFSQSDSMSALSGRSKDRDKSWFTLCVFDQSDVKVRRKYFFYMDESAFRTPTPPKRCLIPPRGTLVFDTALVVSDELESPHASDTARNIAVFRYIRDKLREDCAVTHSRQSLANNEIVAVSGMLINQVLGSAQVKLDQSPSLASDLAGKGMYFDHISLNRGRVRLKIQGKVALMRIEVGIPS